jgi:hypothetical protein
MTIIPQPPLLNVETSLSFRLQDRKIFLFHETSPHSKEQSCSVGRLFLDRLIWLESHYLSHLVLKYSLQNRFTLDTRIAIALT